MTKQLLRLLAVLACLVSPLAVNATAAPGNGESRPDVFKVLCIGGGPHHDYQRWFNQEDSALLESSGSYDVRYTEVPDEAVSLIKQVDAVVISVCKPDFATPEFQRAMIRFMVEGRGIEDFRP